MEKYQEGKGNRPFRRKRSKRGIRGPKLPGGSKLETINQILLDAQANPNVSRGQGPVTRSRVLADVLPRQAELLMQALKREQGGN